MQILVIEWIYVYYKNLLKVMVQKHLYVVLYGEKIKTHIVI